MSVSRGEVVAIHVASAAAAPMRSLDAAAVLAGRGISGDRYAHSRGTYSRGDSDHSPDRQITFIEEEALEAVRRDHGIEVVPADTRRNVLTRGVALNHLVGREFSIGDVRFRGVELCEPCRHVEELSGRAIRKPLVHRGGLNAEVLDDGRIAVGDAIDW
jgi:MOSC domain-containing protein YiiM